MRHAKIDLLFCIPSGRKAHTTPIQTDIMTFDQSELTASVIQRSWRRYRIRRQLQAYQVLDNRWAALTIQDAWWRSRGCTWRLEHKNHVTYQPLWQAAWTIQQAWWRSREYAWRSPQRMMNHQLRRACHNAAYTIQDTWWSHRYTPQEQAAWNAYISRDCAKKKLQEGKRSERGIRCTAADTSYWADESSHWDDEAEDPLYGEQHWLRYVGGHFRDPEDTIYD